MRMILLTPSVAMGNKIAFLFYSENGWIAISEEDQESLFLEKELKNANTDEFQVITDEELYVKIPILRDKMVDKEGTFITIDYENGQVFLNPMHKLKSIFTDTSARATNQANFTADTWTYIMNRKDYYFKVLIISILLIIASIMVSWALLVILFWFLFYTYFSTLASIDNYHMGTLNATMVITTRPTRIAVLTDVTMGGGKYPIVRVCKIGLPKKYNKLKERIPSSCGYQNVKDQRFWDYVLPNPLVFATNDEQAIKHKMAEIPNQDWIELNNWVKTNMNNFYEGYYPIRKEDNDWNNYPDPKFTSFHEEKRP